MEAVSGVRQADPRGSGGWRAGARGPRGLPARGHAFVCAGASASPAAATSIAVVSDAPVLEASDLGDGHYGAILSAAYFVADGLRHAYVVGFGDARGDQEVFHATSSDGLAWEIDENPPFEELGLELSPPAPFRAA